MAHTVLIPDRLSPPADVEQDELGPNFKIILGQSSDASKISDRVWGEVDAVIAWHDIKINSEVIGKLKKCKIIVRCGVGFDSVDLQAAGARGIPVCNVPDYGTEDVADHTLAMLLSLMRGLSAYDSSSKKPDGWIWDAAGHLGRISGARLGLVGMGRIGSSVALRAKAFGMKVSFYDPYIPDGYDKVYRVSRKNSIKDLLKDLDAVSIHIPLTPETKHFVSEKFFSYLKNGAILINTSRGCIVDMISLEKALKSKKLKAAGLDVLEKEPPDRNNSLIKSWINNESWIKNRLIITPHAAFFCQESFWEMRNKAAKTVKSFLTKKVINNCVNLKYLQNFEHAKKK